MKNITLVLFVFCGLVVSARLPQKNAGRKKLYGMEYRIVRETHGKRVAIGDVVEFNAIAILDTTGGQHIDTLADSRKTLPALPVTKCDSGKTGDFKSLFPFMAAGDSAIVYISCDTLLKLVPPGRKIPEIFKRGGMITVYFSVVSDKSYEEYMSEQKVKDAEKEKINQAAAAKQAVVDDKILQDYFAKYNLKPAKTASGLYYSILKTGTGDNAKAGQKVTANYTGQTLDGKKFDSNTDPKFNHVEPFSFEAGKGSVIKGWDEGVMHLKKGSKATFYIPSGLAYGATGAGGDIGPNAVLIFDIELVNIEN